jgi:hypothetical protein
VDGSRVRLGLVGGSGPRPNRKVCSRPHWIDTGLDLHSIGSDRQIIIITTTNITIIATIAINTIITIDIDAHGD